jgi:transcriptional regulator with XRE-family HTH domain
MSIVRYPELAAELARRDIAHATVADAVGCSTAVISQIIRGRVNPSTGLRQRIADYLGVDVDTLFTENPLVVELTEYARRRVAETCAEQGVDVAPPENVRDVVAAMIGGAG